MMKYFMLLLAIACLGSAAPARAEMTGQEKIQASKAEFRVCADPDNLPFSNRQGKGFENKIAELLARSAGQPLVYYWWPARRGFINKTLNAWECDVVIGVPTGYELTRTTQPYYCSRYVMVYRPGERLSPSLLGEPSARSLRIGVVERTPPLDLALRHNLDPVVYFTNYDYVSNFPGQIVTDVATGKLDVALVWGPVGGIFRPAAVSPVADRGVRKSRRSARAIGVSDLVRRAARRQGACGTPRDADARTCRPRSRAILSDNGIPLARIPPNVRRRSSTPRSTPPYSCPRLPCPPSMCKSSPTWPRTPIPVRPASKEWLTRRTNRKPQRTNRNRPRIPPSTAREPKPWTISKNLPVVRRLRDIHTSCRTARRMRKPIRAGFAFPHSAKCATAPAEWERDRSQPYAGPEDSKPAPIRNHRQLWPEGQSGDRRHAGLGQQSQHQSLHCGPLGLPERSRRWCSGCWSPRENEHVQMSSLQRNSLRIPNHRPTRGRRDRQAGQSDAATAASNEQPDFDFRVLENVLFHLSIFKSDGRAMAPGARYG